MSDSESWETKMDRVAAWCRANPDRIAEIRVENQRSATREEVPRPVTPTEHPWTPFRVDALLPPIFEEVPRVAAMHRLLAIATGRPCDIGPTPGWSKVTAQELDEALDALLDDQAFREQLNAVAIDTWREMWSDEG